VQRFSAPSQAATLDTPDLPLKARTRTWLGAQSGAFCPSDRSNLVVYGRQGASTTLVGKLSCCGSDLM